MNTARPFHGSRTFLKSTGDEAAKFLVVGLPMDCGTSNRSGAKHGPTALREASLMLTDGLHPRYLVDPSRHVCDLGDLPIPNNSIDACLKLITSEVQRLAPKLSSGSIFIGLGGDHTVTLGTLRGMAEIHGKLAIVHIDAHSDCSPDNFGDPIGHGTWLRNAIDEGLVDATKTVSIGVRAPTSLSGASFLEHHGGVTLDGDHCAFTHPQDAATLVRDRIQNSKVFLSFDIDGLDPSFAPGTGTPEIGGITTAWAKSFIQELQKCNWVGMDLVEVAPAYDHSEITSLAGATMIHTFMSMILGEKNGK